MKKTQSPRNRSLNLEVMTLILLYTLQEGRPYTGYTRPTLQNDHLFISSISNPSSQDFRPAASPTRQIAMMLWATLWWYFHQPEPELRVTTDASAKTVEEGRPKGEWKININREGIFKGKNLLAKLERMGLICCEDSSVGAALEEKHSPAWTKMFVSRRAFWQIDARLYLFRLSPIGASPLPGASPMNSRPSSPRRNESGRSSPGPDSRIRDALTKISITPLGSDPFASSSNLPTYFPPHPIQYQFTNGIRHPMRAKPFAQGETFMRVTSPAQASTCRSVSPVYRQRQFPNLGRGQ
ncbi:hypothetical protein MRB53_037322 [Persea americana]|nr:hypothetical protein MRB53_037322 [Persea americana]